MANVEVGATYSGLTRVTFIAKDSFHWADPYGTMVDGYRIAVDLWYTIELTLPVDVSVYNNDQMYPYSSGRVSFNVTVPKNEGMAVITYKGSITVTVEGKTGHKYIDETKSKGITTPMSPGQEISLPEAPTRIDVPPITVNIAPRATLSLICWIHGKPSVKGHATYSPVSLEWRYPGDVQKVTVYSSSTAQVGDTITLMIGDFGCSFVCYYAQLELYVYDVDKWILGPCYGNEHAIPPTPPDQTVPFYITIIPEFSQVLIIPIFLAVTLFVIITKKKWK
jgi:hypothetical protein